MTRLYLSNSNCRLAIKDQSRRLVQLSDPPGQHHPGQNRAALNPEHVSTLYACKTIRLNLYPALTVHKWQLTYLLYITEQELFLSN